MCRHNNYNSPKICYVNRIIAKEHYIAYYYFSATAAPNVASSQEIEIPALEDISEEEAETACAKESKSTTLKAAKLKVPRK